MGSLISVSFPRERVVHMVGHECMWVLPDSRRGGGGGGDIGSSTPLGLIDINIVRQVSGTDISCKRKTD